MRQRRRQPFAARDHHRAGCGPRGARSPRRARGVSGMTMGLSDQITTFVDRSFARETAFLAELVKVASDNPPGECAPHAARAKALLEGLGLKVEAHPVPPELAQACGMVSATNLIVRHCFG